MCKENSLNWCWITSYAVGIMGRVILKNSSSEQIPVKATPLPGVTYVDVIKEVPVEVIKEVRVEVPVEVVKEIRVEVPVEVIKTVMIEVPIEVVKEVPVLIEKVIEKEVIKYNNVVDVRGLMEEKAKNSILISKNKKLKLLSASLLILSIILGVL